MDSRFRNNLIKGLGVLEPGNSLQDLFQRPATQRATAVVRLCEVPLDYWTELADGFSRDQAPKVRIEFARSLALTKNIPTDAYAIIDTLSRDSDWRVRLNVIDAALGIGASDAFPILSRLMQDNNTEVKAAATTVFNRLSAIYPLEGAKYRIILTAQPEKEKEEIPRYYPNNLDIRNLSGGPGGGREAKAEKPEPSHKPKPPRTPKPPKHSEPAKPDARNSREATADENIRVVNAWFKGHPDPFKPLQYKKTYQLNIEISPYERAGRLEMDRKDFPEPPGADEEVLDLVVALISDGFAFLEEPIRRLKIPKDTSKASAPIQFKLQPIRDGDLKITALFYYHNNLFHEAVIGCSAGIQETTRARRIAYQPVVNVRGSVTKPSEFDVNLQVKRTQTGYRLILFYDDGLDQFGIASCSLRLSQGDVASLIHKAQQSLLSATNAFLELKNGEEVYRFSESERSAAKASRLPKMSVTDDETYQAVLRDLASAGRLLFAGLFYPANASDEESKALEAMAELFKSLSRGHSLKIQILSQEFFFPWNLLYDYEGEFPPEEVDPKDFWGFRHQIEEVPRDLVDHRIRAIPVKKSEKIHIGMNINKSLPEAFWKPQVDTIHSWKPRIRLSERSLEQEVIDALLGKDASLDLEYYYCHAATGSPERRYDDSVLTLTDDGLTLGDVIARVLNRKFVGNPVLILNACDSARLDGRFYDGFVQKFLKMGAASVIGTDAQIPSVFAAHFGMELVKILMHGKPVGKALLDIRCQMLTEYKNPLGLIYRVFGSTDAYFPEVLLQ